MESGGSKQQAGSQRTVAETSKKKKSLKLKRR